MGAGPIARCRSRSPRCSSSRIRPSRPRRCSRTRRRRPRDARRARRGPRRRLLRRRASTLRGGQGAASVHRATGSPPSRPCSARRTTELPARGSERHAGRVRANHQRNRRGPGSPESGRCVRRSTPRLPDAAARSPPAAPHRPSRGSPRRSRRPRSPANRAPTASRAGPGGRLQPNRVRAGAMTLTAPAAHSCVERRACCARNRGSGVPTRTARVKPLVVRGPLVPPTNHRPALPRDCSRVDDE